MRAMPTLAQASMNPNDFSGQGKGYQKKQYADVNQHYIHHNAVLPPASFMPQNRNEQSGAYYKDPYSNITAKPNQLSIESSNQLLNQINASTPAGMLSELRKSSPISSGGNGIQNQPRGRVAGISYDRAGQEMSGRAGNGNIGDYMRPEYGSVTKVQPQSRDLNPMGIGDGNNLGVFSSKPSDNYQSMTIDQASANAYGEAPYNELSREMMRRQEEQDFIEEEMNFARKGSIGSIEMNNLPPTQIGPKSDNQPIRDNFNGPSRTLAQAKIAEPTSISIGQIGNDYKPNQRVGGNRMRGRIHASNDVINGISGMEHLSNTIQPRPNGIEIAGGPTSIMMSQIRAGTTPQTDLLDQLKNVQIHQQGPLAADNGLLKGMKSSQSRSNLPLQPELEYDPWYANQQRYLAAQGAALNKQAHIYQKHLNDFTLRKQEDEEKNRQQELQRQEQARVRAGQQLEQQRIYKHEMKNQYKSILDDQMNQNKMSKEIEAQEKMSLARISQQRGEMQRLQENQMRSLKMQQQMEYRQVLDGQKVTRGLGLQQLAGDVPMVGQTRIRSGVISSPHNSIQKVYQSQGQSQTRPGLNNQSLNNYSMPAMPAMQQPPAGVRRMPQF